MSILYILGFIFWEPKKDFLFLSVVVVYFSRFYVWQSLLWGFQSNMKLIKEFGTPRVVKEICLITVAFFLLSKLLPTEANFGQTYRGPEQTTFLPKIFHFFEVPIFQHAQNFFSFFKVKNKGLQTFPNSCAGLK